MAVNGTNVTLPSLKGEPNADLALTSARSTLLLVCVCDAISFLTTVETMLWGNLENFMTKVHEFFSLTAFLSSSYCILLSYVMLRVYST